MIEFNTRIHIWAVIACALLFVSLFELVRRNRLKEKYSLLWFVTVLVTSILSVQRSWLDRVASVLGIHYPPSALFLVVVAFLLLLLGHFSTVVSRLIQDKQRVAQEAGLLERRVRQLENATRAQRSDER